MRLELRSIALVRGKLAKSASVMLTLPPGNPLSLRTLVVFIDKRARRCLLRPMRIIKEDPTITKTTIAPMHSPMMTDGLIPAVMIYRAVLKELVELFRSALRGRHRQYDVERYLADKVRTEMAP